MRCKWPNSRKKASSVKDYLASVVYADMPEAGNEAVPYTGKHHQDLQYGQVSMAKRPPNAPGNLGLAPRSVNWDCKV